MNKFKKPQFQAHYTPEDAYNEIFNATDLIPYQKEQADVWTVEGKNVFWSGELVLKFNEKNKSYSYIPPAKLPNLIPWADESTEYRPHQILYQLRFKGEHEKARNFVVNTYLNEESKYVRIGIKYFKEIVKENKYSLEIPDIVIWNKDSIIDDYGRGELKRVRKYDDFTVYPNNVEYQKTHNGFYNLYKPFIHKPHSEPVSITDIPYISKLMYHIFGEQQELGYQYIKILYEEPWQVLPVLCLVSKENETGKTTFLKLLANIFTGNFDVISSDNLSSSFNSAYAYLNIIGVDETVIEKQMAVERIKMLSTADTIMVNMKNVQEFSIPFYGKLILCTNKETDFMRIGSEEIRFWIRKPGLIKKKDPGMIERMIGEIPMFLRYLKQMEPAQKLTRMVFTPEQLRNKYLDVVKEESKSGLRKEIEILLTDFFHNNPHLDSVKFSAIDLKNKWFERDSRINMHYVRKVLQEEMGLKPSAKVERYSPFSETETTLGVNTEVTKTGTPYHVERLTLNTVLNTVLNTEQSDDKPLNYKDFGNDSLEF